MRVRRPGRSFRSRSKPSAGAESLRKPARPKVPHPLAVGRGSEKRLRSRQGLLLAPAIRSAEMLRTGPSDQSSATLLTLQECSRLRLLTSPLWRHRPPRVSCNPPEALSRSEKVAGHFMFMPLPHDAHRRRRNKLLSRSGVTVAFCRCSRFFVPSLAKCQWTRNFAVISASNIFPL
jgi:hypothetical protein